MHEEHGLPRPRRVDPLGVQHGLGQPAGRDRGGGDTGQQDVGHGCSSEPGAAAHASDGVPTATASAPRRRDRGHPRLPGARPTVGGDDRLAHHRPRLGGPEDTHSAPPVARTAGQPPAVVPRSPGAGRRSRGGRRAGTPPAGGRPSSSSSRCWSGSPGTPRTRDVPRVPGQCTLAGLVDDGDRRAGGERRDDRRRRPRARGLPERAVVIALATAQQESRLRNLDYGDRDSLGLFQQRPVVRAGAPRRRCRTRSTRRASSTTDWSRCRTGRPAGSPTSPSACSVSGFPEAYQQWEAMAPKLAAAQVSELPRPSSSPDAPSGTERCAVPTGGHGAMALNEACPAPTCLA